MSNQLVAGQTFIYPLPYWHQDFMNLTCHQFRYIDEHIGFFEMVVSTWLDHYTPDRDDNWTSYLWCEMTEYLEVILTSDTPDSVADDTQRLCQTVCHWVDAHCPLINDYLVHATFQTDPRCWVEPQLVGDKRFLLLTYIGDNV